MTESPARSPALADLPYTSFPAPLPEQPSCPTTIAGQPVRLMTIVDVISRVGLQKSWIYSAIKSGEFPSPLKSISARRTLFSSHDIERWLIEKTSAPKPIAARDAG